MILTGREVHPVLPLLDPEVEKASNKAEVDEFYALRAEAMRMEATDPFRFGYEPHIWKLADQKLAEFRKRFPVGVVTELDLGGNRACLVEGTLIRCLNAIRGRHTAIERLEKGSRVKALDIATGLVAETEIEKPFCKGSLDCIRVTLSRGGTFECSYNHRVLLVSGGWSEACNLKIGSKLAAEYGIAVSVTGLKHIGKRKCWDFHVPGYENYMHAGVCHHNSKSERRAKRLVQNMVANPGWRAWALQSNETSSRQNQQSIIYKYLPPEWRPDSGAMRQGRTTKIVYKQATGFTENVLVCPNGSECRFKFYGMDVSGVEGAELNEAWADELITPDWIEALIFRLVTRNGLLGITFTPIEGYSATVKAYLDGAITTEEVIAELLPIRNASNVVTGHEKVPRVQENVNAVVNGQRSKAVIVYFHTADNPYGNYPSMKETLEGAARDKILTRAYGVPSKAFGSALPMFRTNVHVMSVNQWEAILRDNPNGTRYHLVDPCSGRNWFQIWVYCLPGGKKIIYREWPSHGHTGAYIQGIGDPGEWTIPGKAEDGERGPAQKAFGFGLERYKEEIETLEKGEDIFERYMDARTANAPTATREGTTTLIEQMDELGMMFRGASAEKSVFSNSGDGSLDLLNSELYYDVDTPIGDYSARLARINSPNLLVLETCPNVIYSMSNWTGRDGQAGASKDPIDVARMIVLNELDYVDDSMLKPRQPWLQQFSGRAA